MAVAVQVVETTRVGVLDDRAMVRAGLRALLDEAGDVDVRWLSADLREALSLLSTQVIDTLVFSLDLVGPSPSATAARLRAGGAGVHLVAMTSRPGVDARLLGDLELVDIASSMQEIAIAVRAGARHDLARYSAPRPTDMSPAELTPREFAIIGMLRDAPSNREIARGLGIAEATVKRHLVSIFTKFDVHSRGQAVLAARRAGLVV